MPVRPAGEDEWVDLVKIQPHVHDIDVEALPNRFFFPSENKFD